MRCVLPCRARSKAEEPLSHNKSFATNLGNERAPAGRSYTVNYFDRPGSGPTILYIHGMGCSSADFIDMSFVPELKPVHLISADDHGCGDASCEEKHALNIGAVVELVENFVEELRFSRFLLVGGSMEGLVPLLYAEHNPDKIGGFVNVEGNLAPEDCMFSRKVLPHSYPHFDCIVFPQKKGDICRRYS